VDGPRPASSGAGEFIWGAAKGAVAATLFWAVMSGVQKVAPNPISRAFVTPSRLRLPAGIAVLLIGGFCGLSGPSTETKKSSAPSREEPKPEEAPVERAGKMWPGLSDELLLEIGDHTSLPRAQFERVMEGVWSKPLVGDEQPTEVVALAYRFAGHLSQDVEIAPLVQLDDQGTRWKVSEEVSCAIEKEGIGCYSKSIDETSLFALSSPDLFLKMVAFLGLQIVHPSSYRTDVQKQQIVESTLRYAKGKLGNMNCSDDFLGQFVRCGGLEPLSDEAIGALYLPLDRVTKDEIRSLIGERYEGAPIPDVEGKQFLNAIVLTRWLKGISNPEKTRVFANTAAIAYRVAKALAGVVSQIERVSVPRQAVEGQWKVKPEMGSSLVRGGLGSYSGGVFTLDASIEPRDFVEACVLLRIGEK